MLELDLQFAKFIQVGGLNQLNDEELNGYNQLLEMDDGDLLLLLQGNQLRTNELCNNVTPCMQSVINQIRST
jgi:succinate dehydrogenase flavin-adding protein (antitoxin of CptAB toxin-antitoxin module)